MSLLQLQQLSFGYSPRTPLTIDIRTGERWVILGQNGTGKTTLLHTLIGLHQSRSGKIILNDTALAQVPRKKRARELGILLQDHHTALPLSVGEYIDHAFYARTDLSTQEKRHRKQLTLAMFSLTTKQNHLLKSLSGGERKRAALAALFIQDPRFYLLDEPCNHLDLKHQQNLFHQLRTLCDHQQRGVILTLHDVQLAEQIATHVLLLFQDGSYHAGPAAACLTETRLSQLYEHPLECHKHRETVFWKARVCHTHEQILKEGTHEH